MEWYLMIDDFYLALGLACVSLTSVCKLWSYSDQYFTIFVIYMWL